MARQLAQSDDISMKAPARPKSRVIAPKPRGNWPWFLVLLTAVLIVYHAVPGFEYVNYDDDRYIQNNRALDGGLTLKNLRWAFEANLLYGSREAEYWQPVTSISRLVDRSLFGTGPAGPHVQSLLLHALNACLLFRLLRRLGGKEFFSGLVSLIFALHPLNAEAVCWLAGRKDLLCGLGSLLTLLAYTGFVARPTIGRFGLSLLAYAFALMAKPSALVLPVIMILFDLWPLRRKGAIGMETRAGELTRLGGLMAEKLPFFLMAGLVSGLTFVSQQEVGGIHAPMQSLWVRLASVAIGYTEYLRMFIWPAGLCVLYPATGEAPESIAVAGAILLLSSITAFLFFARRRVPAAFTGWFWFLAMLAPLMGVVSFGRQSAADRYMYLPLVGLAVILVSLSGVVFARIHRSSRRRWTVAAAIGLVLVLGSASYAQSLIWKDSGVLWRKALEGNFDNAVAHSNYGVFLARAGDERGAELQFRLALKLEPESPAMGEQLAVLLMSQHRYEPVIPLAERLIQISPGTMSFHRILGTAYDGLGQPQMALKVRVRQEAIRGRIFLTQGLAFVERQEWLSAREQLGQAWSSQDALELLTGQRLALLPAGQWASRAQAAFTFQDVPATAPKAAVGGLVLALQGRWRDAGSAFGECCRLDPSDLDAQWRRAVCRLRAGESDLARREYQDLFSRGLGTPDLNRAWEAAQRSPPP